MVFVFSRATYNNDLYFNLPPGFNASAGNWNHEIWPAYFRVGVILIQIGWMYNNLRNYNPKDLSPCGVLFSK